MVYVFGPVDLSVTTERIVQWVFDALLYFMIFMNFKFFTRRKEK
jgi:hypothetical protein